MSQVFFAIAHTNVSRNVAGREEEGGRRGKVKERKGEGGREKVGKGGRRES